MRVLTILAVLGAFLTPSAAAEQLTGCLGSYRGILYRVQQGAEPSGTCLSQDSVVTWNQEIAAEAVPIDSPGSITESGNYVLVADIAVSDGLALSIAAPHVSLDLNTHSVTSTSPDGAITATVSTIDIRNGYITSLSSASSTALTIIADHRAVVENVFVNANFDGIRLTGGDVRMTGCTVEVNPSGESGVHIVADTGQLLHNYVLAPTGFDPMHVTFNNGEIRGNRSSTQSISGGVALYVGGLNNTVIDNELNGGTFNLWLTGAGHRVVHNACIEPDESYGIVVESSHSWIEGNTVRTNVGDGMRIDGSRNIIRSNSVYSVAGMTVTGNHNLIEDNLLSEVVVGLNFLEDATENVFRRNVVRASGNPLVDSGVGNTDTGDNVLTLTTLTVRSSQSAETGLSRLLRPRNRRSGASP